MAAENKKPQAQITRWSFGSGNTFMWLGLTLLVLGWFSQNGNGGGQSVLPKQPPICDDAKGVDVPMPGSVNIQKAWPDCLSGLIKNYDVSGAGKITNFKVYGSVDVCMWNDDRCSGWMHLSVDNHNDPADRGESLPKYGAFRLIGDPGPVEIRSFDR